MKHNSYHIGDIFTNQDLMDTFGVSNSGGMRRSLANNCLLLIHKADSIYHDRWENGILKYTGMGLKGDQDINFHQNKTLSQSKTSGIQVLLFDNLKTIRAMNGGRYLSSHIQLFLKFMKDYKFSPDRHTGQERNLLNQDIFLVKIRLI